MTLSELKKLAQSATKGFWFFNREHGLHVLLIPTAEPHHIASEVKIADGRYIQAMQPQTALRMIELLEGAKKEFELMCAYFEHDRQVVLHKNDIVPDAEKWLKDLEEL